MKVLMLPSLAQAKSGRDGISQVILAYHKYLPDYDIELVVPETDDYDLIAGHIYQGVDLPGKFINHNHGLHWTSDYSNYGAAQYKMNEHLVNAIRRADEITVPSSWVAETFQRDMRFTPHVISHGIDWEDWQNKEPQGNYVLWNKNRAIGVCDPSPLVALSQRFSKSHFVTTFLPRNVPQLDNVNVTGTIPHDQMKKLVQSSMVYLATTKETFGIGILEAMASGVPVLGFAHGGILDLVEHGVNGYLVKPNDIDDLAEGLAYCIKHRKILGGNGREMAKAWTWQTACEKVAGVYRLAIQDKPATVGVVIPVYNKSEQELRRAIESVKNQSCKAAQVIVVDDGSEDSLGQTYQRLCDEYEVELIRQSNQGVANARNRGIERFNTKYAVCLDADDWIEKDFILRCIKELENDNSLGIAYTGLQYYKPDSTTGISPWPGEWDFDRQLKRHNQVPTCCVFRREMWERLGGYRQRYAPTGAGAEDAEMWLRAGAFGWKAAKVTDEALFNYSWQSGEVSGNPAYKEIDWLAWAPYAKDSQHPFVSYATPTLSNFSHPIRQYDEPLISVIIPVGPGHEKDVIEALDSLEAQSFRKWEAIVVWDFDMFEYETLGNQIDDQVTECNIKPEIENIGLAYPYVKFRSTGVTPRGAGWARNFGASFARAPLLFFLDADDWLYDTRALEKMLVAWNEYEAIPYSDYVGRSFIEDPKDVEKLNDNGRLLAYNDKTHEALTKFKAFDFDCERVMKQPELPHPYTFCLISTLVPKAWHNEIGGFDEDMPSWEDVDYHWRMVRAGKCYYRIEEPLILYRFYTGHRREGGRQNFKNLVQYISDKYEKGDNPVGCGGGCGGKKTSVTSNVFQSSKQQAQAMSVEGLKDEDFVKVKLVDGNRGDHQVIGTTAINPVTKRKFNYGQRSDGDEILVHKNDVYMTDRNGHTILRDARRFQPIQEQRVKEPKVEKKEMVVPQPIREVEEPVAGWSFVTEEEARKAQEGPIIEFKGIETQINTGPVDAHTGEVIEIRTDDGINPEEMVQAADIIEQFREENPPLNLQTLPGVTDNIAGELEALGLSTKDDILRFGVEGLMTIKGIGEKRAEGIIKAIGDE